MEDIKVGEYVRTNNGLIGQVVQITDYSYVIRIYNGAEYVVRATITKHSFNLIDLLETDDIVVLEYYVKKFGKRITRKFEVFKCYALIKFNNTHCDFLYDLNEKKWTEEEYDIQIISILTHEQYEQNCYKVKGE